MLDYQSILKYYINILIHIIKYITIEVIKMKFNENKIFMILIGLLIVTLIIPTISASIFGSNTIENNKTIDLNGVRLTVPNSDNFTINESSTLDYHSYSKKK